MHQNHIEPESKKITQVFPFQIDSHDEFMDFLCLLKVLFILKMKHDIPIINKKNIYE